MASRAFITFVKSNSRNPTAKELYLQQFPGATPAACNRRSTTPPRRSPRPPTLRHYRKAVATIPNSDKLDLGAADEHPTPDPIPANPGAGPRLADACDVAAALAATPIPRSSRAWRRPRACSTDLKINTPLRMAHFMAQITQESGGGTEMTESLSYTR